MRKQGKWNPLRVLEAIGSIGYDPVSAILDIVDNSISAGASKIDIFLRITQSTEGKGKRRAVIDEITIKDDAKGMDEGLIDNAISLGSSTEFYDKNTLSKFGMGLKSASSMLGKKLEIITRTEGNSILKAILDQEEIQASGGEYVYDLVEPDEGEVKKFNDFVGENSHSGTFIIISKINQRSMPSVAEILDNLKRKIGIVYYYYIRAESEKIEFTVDSQPIEPFDPLFTDEITENEGNLDELNWDGLETKWIVKEQTIQLDEQDASCVANVVITQLPHPPSVGDKGDISQKACRDKYMIGAGNYGFYIYRNKRLISWAESLDMVGQSQDLYSFRGRILIDSDSDDILNIDVTKSRIKLSELAKSQLTPVVQEAKKKSIDAWNTAKERIRRKANQDPHNEINEELDKISEIVEKNDQLDEEVAPAPEKAKLKQRREQTVESQKATPQEKRNLAESGQRVHYVSSLENNQLWQRAHDPEHGLIVRVNSSHRLIREILDSQTNNPLLVKVLDVLFFALARGEYSLVYKSDYDPSLTEQLIKDYREYVGNDLSEIIKKINIFSLLNTSD
jgi:hypothetical protein